MSQPPNIDGVLIQWGDRLFYPSKRVARTQPQPRLNGLTARQRAVAIREMIESCSLAPPESEENPTVTPSRVRDAIWRSSVTSTVVPWPGSRGPESFTLASRLNIDSTRSPTWPATAVIARTDPNEQESVVLLPELEALVPA